MQRKLSVFLLAVACAVFVGCSKDSEIEEVTAELHAFSEELVKKVETAPNPSAGVDEAQKLMDSRKAEMQAKLNSVKDVRGFQVDKETQQKMVNTLMEDAKKVAGLQIKYMNVSMRDPAFKAKLDKLIKDYTEVFRLQ